jgi:hypothetical protein
MFTTAHHGCNPEPAESAPLSYMFKHYSHIYAQVPEVGSSLHVLTKILYAFITSLMHATCPTHLMKNANYEAPHYAVPPWDPNIPLGSVGSPDSVMGCDLM